jgi:hypothetical protein
MKIFLILSTFFISLSFVEPTALNSYYDLVKNSGLGSSYDSFKICEYTNKMSKAKCISQCNRYENCTLVVYAIDTKVCQLYSIASFTFEANSNQVAAIKTSTNFNSSMYTNNTSATPTQTLTSQNTIDSLILTSTEAQKIHELGAFSSHQELNLLYRATRDGFSATAFHSKCDGYLNTLTIAESTNGYVFGGFTTQLWNSCICYRSDPSAFILSVRRNTTGFNTETDARRFNVTDPFYAIRAHVNYGPRFGNETGQDLHIANMSNTNQNSFSSFGNSYEHPSEYAAQSFNASNYLTGCTVLSAQNCKFSTVEIEVFQLVNKSLTTAASTTLMP